MMTSTCRAQIRRQFWRPKDAWPKDAWPKAPVPGVSYARQVPAHLRPQCTIRTAAAFLAALGGLLAPPVATAELPPFPEPAPAPTIAELQALTARVSALSSPMGPGKGSLIGEDWETAGDWIGRYGRRYAVLCATRSPLNHLIETDDRFNVSGATGVTTGAPEYVRRWIQWIQTDDPRVLYNPVLGYRREAEWDDHGEVRPLTIQGPDLWVSVKVPAGAWRLSLYFMNKDGHDGMNRVRDYVVELRLQEPGKAIRDAYGAGATAMPVLAHTRVLNFWGGVYKQFAVTGPGNFYVKVDRNYSLNAILVAVMLDALPTSVDLANPAPLPWMCGIHYPPIDPSTIVPFLSGDARMHPRRRPNPFDQVRDKPLAAAAILLWNALDAAQPQDSGLDREARILALRAGTAAGLPDVTLAAWRWMAGTWTADDRRQFQDAMAAARKILLQSQAK